MGNEFLRPADCDVESIVQKWPADFLSLFPHVSGGIGAIQSLHRYSSGHERLNQPAAIRAEIFNASTAILAVDRRTSDLVGKKRGGVFEPDMHVSKKHVQAQVLLS
jgi:hypothetical protein